MSKENVSVISTPTGVEDLITASKQLLNATEQQFERIRKEKWFHRLFDMITFSQKKNIRLGEQIQTLSQAQNIFLEILARSEATHPELAACIDEQREKIECITQNNLSLLQLYKKLYQQIENERLGIIKSQDISMMSEANKLVLSGCLRMLAQNYEEPSALQQRYFNTIHSYIGCENEGEICWESFSKIPEDARKQILLCCLEYVFLQHNDFVLSDNLKEFIDNFDLGAKTLRERHSLVSEMFHARGAEGIINKYSAYNSYEDIPDTFEIEWDADNMCIASVESEEFRQLYAQALAGDAEAQCQVGICYYNGDGVEEDVQSAIYWYRRSAEQGYADAQNRLGVRYDNGNGVEEDSAIAIQWFEKAAEQGHAKAQCNLGRHYLSGDGVPEDDAKAFIWFSMSAEKGYAEAQYYKGECYMKGWGTDANEDNAAYWFEKAAEQNHVKAQFRLTTIYISSDCKTDEKKGAYWARKAAEQGHSTAQYLLGLCYADGLGVEKNPVEAVYWYKKAAVQENADALVSLGACYLFGTDSAFIKSKGILKDLRKARECLKKAIEIGEVDGFLQDNNLMYAHRLLAVAIYAQNVKDFLSWDALKIANCVPFVNFVSFPVTGILSIAEKKKLRGFLTTEDGRSMMYHCKTAAEAGDKYAADMLKKLRRAL